MKPLPLVTVEASAVHRFPYRGFAWQAGATFELTVAVRPLALSAVRNAALWARGRVRRAL